MGGNANAESATAPSPYITDATSIALGTAEGLTHIRKLDLPPRPVYPSPPGAEFPPQAHSFPACAVITVTVSVAPHVKP